MRNSALWRAPSALARLLVLLPGSETSLPRFGKLPRCIRALVAAGQLLALAACGGGGGSPTEDPPPEPPPPPAAKPQAGWTPVENWPLIAIHAVLTPGGNVLTYGSDKAGRRTGRFEYDVWDWRAGLAGGHTTLQNVTNTDIFCSAQIVLPQGDVFIAGGDQYDATTGKSKERGIPDASLFSPANNTLRLSPSRMNRNRWYATITTLPSGEHYIQGGLGGTPTEPEKDPLGGHAQPELRKADGSFELLDLNTAGLSYSYPRNFVTPDGRIFGIDVRGRMYFISADLSQLSRPGDLIPIDLTEKNAPLSGAGTALFAPGRVLVFGGGLTQAFVVAFDGPLPEVTALAAPSSQRNLVNATILADGSVLATGGSRVYNALDDVTYQAEIWNPATAKWTVHTSGQRARLYHSIALLLPDASVLVAGGGADGPETNLNAEIYSPPYLYSSDGTLAPRPTIINQPQPIVAGTPFSVTVGTSDEISRVTLIKTGSVTHSWNMDQRFVPVTFQQSAPGAALTVTPPANRFLMTPGYYLLFVFNKAGAPSVAKIVQVPVPAA